MGRDQELVGGVLLGGALGHGLLLARELLALQLLRLRLRLGLPPDSGRVSTPGAVVIATTIMVSILINGGEEGGRSTTAIHVTHGMHVIIWHLEIDEPYIILYYIYKMQVAHLVLGVGELDQLGLPLDDLGLHPAARRPRQAPLLEAQI
jgi:hypothetical protein